MYITVQKGLVRFHYLIKNTEKNVLFRYVNKDRLSAAISHVFSVT